MDYPKTTLLPTGSIYPLNGPTPKDSETVFLQLTPEDHRRLATLCGQLNQHIKQIEQHLGVVIGNRGSDFNVTGEPQQAARAAQVLQQLYSETLNNTAISADDVHLALQQSGMDESATSTNAYQQPQVLIRANKLTIKPRGAHQNEYVSSIRENDINFGIGPAGTGKTFLAVACAVEALSQDRIQRILLVRPAVEAGEKLGFLPGDLSQKVDPYLRPLYDALYEMLGFDTVGKLIERHVIEVAPLAFMRGRTLNNSFVILDESQNTTAEQMKMFLTRIGFGTTAVITGDPSQTDLPKHQTSGLFHASRILSGVAGISFTHFNARDVVRHPLVQRIVEAYEAAEQREAKPDNS